MTLAIIQARMGSTRLAGKVLADVCGRPLLWYVVTRVKRARRIDQVVVAIPDTAADQAIARRCAKWGVLCMAGDEHDVLLRYVTIAERLQPEVIVRITADCPCIDPEVIDGTIARLRSNAWASNLVPRTWPDGLDVEVMTRRRLRRLDDETADAAEREHVTPALYRGPAGGVFRCPIKGLGAVRWTVDMQADLNWVRELYAQVPWLASWRQMLRAPVGMRRAA